MKHLLQLALVLALAGCSTSRAQAPVPAPLPTTFTIAWEPSSDQTVTGYNVHYGTASGVYSTTVDVGMVTSKVLANPPTGTTYYLVVTCYNAASLESLPSNEVTWSGPVRPSAPTNARILPYKK